MSGPIKVAILGGGMGGLAAAWELSRQPDADKRFDITVYQRGWRLGGKGASGGAVDAEDGRIEEHGLHILMGFYRNAFEILEDCYAELAAHPEVWPGGKLLPWAEALAPQDHISVAEPRSGDWEFWEVPLAALKPMAAGASLFQKFLQDIPSWIQWLWKEIKPGGGGGSPHLLAINLQLAIETLPQASRERQLEVAALLRAIVLDAWQSVDTTVGIGTRLRQLLSGLYLASTSLSGLIEDGVINEPHDFSPLNRFDFKEWLHNHEHGLPLPKEISWFSPLVRAVYDLPFSLNHTHAAGVTCYNLMNILFGFSKDVYYKMNGGMGDVVFAPLYLTLKYRRNVKFRFFHRVTAIEVDDAYHSIDAITLEPQVTGGSTYEPMEPNLKGGFPSWPNEPILKRMDAEYQRQRQGRRTPPHDFETEIKSPFAAAPLTLVKGRNFDDVVLAISVGGLKGPLGMPLRGNPRFDAMLNGASTMPTQAFQVWLKRPPTGSDGIGWTQGRAMSGYAEPFTSCTDMNQVLTKEHFPAPQPQTVAYVCGAFSGAPSDKPAALVKVRANADAWLDEHVFRLWPKVAKAGKFDRNELVDPERGFYVRANVDPSDQYVLSPSGSIESRLAPDDSGFTNLFLAGDWVRHELSSGCLESAALGGRLAAQAIVNNRSAKPPYVENDGDWVVRPPGMLADVTMHTFILRANPQKLSDICARMINIPSAGAVQVTPLPPGFVILACADIQRGFSLAAPELGWQTEKDVAFFIPVTLQVGGKRSGLAAIVPYIFVDNMAGMITGREVFGFPKLYGDLAFSGDGKSFAAASLVRRRGGADEEVESAPVFQLTSAGHDATDVPGSALELLDGVVARALTELPASLPGLTALAQVPLVFLKQFRDAVVPLSACYQAIIQTTAQITTVRSAKILTGNFNLQLPKYDSLQIADQFGIAESTQPLKVAFELHLDFKLNAGTQLWKAD